MQKVAKELLTMLSRPDYAARMQQVGLAMVLAWLLTLAGGSMVWSAFRD
jgi:hypothetical protein